MKNLKEDWLKALNNRLFTLTSLYFVGLVFWWIKIQLSGSFDGENYYYDWAYGVICALAAFYAVRLSYAKWGGLSSSIGRSLIYLALGLLSQMIGLQIWTYYNLYLKIEAPYPSVADVGYFMLIPFYTLAAYNFAKASGGKSAFSNRQGKIVAGAISILVLILSLVFLQIFVGIDDLYSLKTLFDVAYPVGQTIPFAIALYILYLSNTVLGGTMRSKIMVLTIAFIFQFIAEYGFLIAVGSGKYINGGLNDLLYPLAYYLMFVSIFGFTNVKD